MRAGACVPMRAVGVRALVSEAARYRETQWAIQRHKGKVSTAAC